MSKRSSLLLLLAVALLTAALYAILRGQTEPAYQGRSLSSWLADYDVDLAKRGALLLGEVRLEENVAESQRRQNAEEAIRRIGTNAVPFLLSWIRYEPPAWEDKLNGLLATVGVARRLGANKALRADKAEIAFAILGPRAKAAIPELTRLSNEAKTIESAMRSMTALACLGEEAIPPLVNILTNATRNKEPAMFAIWTMGTNARPAVPALILCLKDQDSIVRDSAANYLGQLRLEPGLVVPALTTTLQDPYASVRLSAVRALRKYSSNAQSATPALLNILTDPDAEVREAVTNALLKIDPEALKRATNGLSP